MNDALIGHTGFVGSTLRRDRRFDHLFNSANIGEIDGGRFDEVVCAGVSAVKWWANQNPEQDRAAIAGLMRHLETIEAARFTLISTIDVYDPPHAVSEADAASSRQPYGRHRAELEDFVARRFASHRIVRLPALFGTGLKKNILFDLMQNHRIEAINPASSFQWYPLSRLAADLERGRALGVSVLNLATEPLATGQIQARFFPDRVIGAAAATAARYDMRSLYAGEFSGSGAYMMQQAAVLDAIGDFVAAARCGA